MKLDQLLLWGIGIAIALSVFNSSQASNALSEQERALLEDEQARRNRDDINAAFANDPLWIKYQQTGSF